MSKRAVQQLRQLLEIERAALLAGDLAAVDELARQKEVLAIQLEAVDARELASVSEALARNGALLAAARDGVELVITTLQKQRAARQTLSSYDKSGRATSISRSVHGTERRF